MGAVHVRVSYAYCTLRFSGTPLDPKALPQHGVPRGRRRRGALIASHLHPAQHKNAIEAGWSSDAPTVV
ncbi:hypothetical protein AOLI_G00057490 [Acnodon oligacanthus]